MNELHFDFLLEGLALGLLVAIPVGPISILCMHRALERGFLSGFVSGMGASTGDFIYAVIGVLSLNLDTTALMNHRVWLSVAGGGFLCYLGVKTFLSQPTGCPGPNPSSTKASAETSALLKDYLTTLALNQINPMTFLPFAAVLTRLYSTNVQADALSSVLFVAGVVAIAVLWRALISKAASWFGAGLAPRQQRWINQLSGISIVAFGCTTLFQ